MLTQLLAGGGILGALLLVVFMAIRQGRNAGKAEGIQETQKKADDKLVEVQNQHNAEIQAENEQVIADVEEVREVHDRLESDPAYAQRVRDRFTRD